jgi:hypothetical protein
VIGGGTPAQCQTMCCSGAPCNNWTTCTTTNCAALCYP